MLSLITLETDVKVCDCVGDMYECVCVFVSIFTLPPMLTLTRLPCVSAS